MKRAFVFFIVVTLLLVSTVFAAYGTNKAPTPSTSSSSSSSSSVSGGGGGSGSSASSGVTGWSAKEVWSSIGAGGTATAAIKDNALGVTEVSFVVPEKVSEVWIQVVKRETLPKSVSGFGRKAYKGLEISKGAVLDKEWSFTDAKIKFKVEKTWLAENTLTKEAVALFRYSDNSWNQLPTLVGKDDGTYVHYTAQTPGFSYFIIGEKFEVTTAEEPVMEETTEKSVEEAVEEVPAEAPVVEKKGISKGLLVALLAAVVVVVAVVLYLRKKR